VERAGWELLWIGLVILGQEKERKNERKKERMKERKKERKMNERNIEDFPLSFSK